VKFLENRRVAWLALVACAALSVFGLGGVKMSSERAAVQSVFTNGSDASDSLHSMRAYLLRAAKAASVMAQEGTVYLGDDNAECARVAELAEALLSEEEGSEAYEQLSGAVENLYTALEKAKLTDEQFVNAKGAYRDFQDAASLIKHDDYHALAAEYNDRTDGFPASVIRGMYGLDAFGTYGR